MQLTGTVHRTKALTSKSGKPITIRVVDPDHTPANRSVLLATDKIWGAQSLALGRAGNYDAARRAHFAADVAFLAASAMAHERRPDYYLLIAQDQTDAIRGLSAYRLENQVWQLDLLTTDPANQGGNPHSDPVRGIGAELLGATAADMAKRLCTTVELEPLDDKAESFWLHAGFHSATGRPPFTMSCPELQALALRYAHTPTDDAHMLADRRAMRARVSLHV